MGMTRELARQFNDEVERYRRSMLYFAVKRDWDEFKSRAGGLFEYVETVEATERERRFYAVFSAIRAMLVLGVLIVLGVDPRVNAVWAEHRQMALMLSLAGCGFEVFFYVNFRTYVQARMAGYQRRRDAFIRNIERDFRSFAMQPETSRS